MRTLAANALARILLAEGTPWVATFPVCCVNNALGEEGMPLIMMRDERYAVAVADAYSRVTNGRGIGVCTVMGGMNPAGLQMAYGALAQAFEDAAPVLCIADGVPSAKMGEPLYDMTAAFGTVCKWVGHINAPERTPEMMRRAYTHLRSGRPSPVLVTMPRGMGAYDMDAYPYTPVKRYVSGPDPADVEAAIEMILKAESPILYAGEGTLYAEAWDELRDLAMLAQMPVMTTLNGMSVFPGNHPLSLGVRGSVAERFLRKSDLVLAVGTSLSWGHFRQAIPNPGEKTIIQCTLDTLDLNRNCPIDHAILGDAKLTLRALIDAYRAAKPQADPPGDPITAQIGDARQEMMARYEPAMTSDETPINPYRVYADLARVLDPDSSFVTHDSGNTRDQLSTIWQARQPRSFMGWGNVSTLGFGLAAAMGAKLAHPDWQCVNVTGDAGVGYMLGNMEALVRNKIGVTTIHINNGGFSGYGPGFWGDGHDPYTCELCDHDVADMSMAVAALGYYAEDVRQPSGIMPAIRRAMSANAQGQPAYLEVLCSRYPVVGAWVTE